jgi:hypothetical protein
MWYWYELVAIGCATFVVIEFIKYLLFDKEQK